MKCNIGLVLLLWLLVSCNHQDKAAAIAQIEKDTGCTFVQHPGELSGIRFVVEGTADGPPYHVWFFEGTFFSKERVGLTLPLVWAVREYANKAEVLGAYWSAYSEAEVIAKDLENQKRDTP